MEQDNQYSAITIFDDIETFKHIYFTVKITLKRAPQICGNITVNVIDNYEPIAMVDTGATICGITTRMVKRMGLESCGTFEFTHAIGMSDAPKYILDVQIKNVMIFKDIEAVEISDDHSHDFIIGMNILSQGDISITYANGKRAFSFRTPSAGKHIDFVQN